MSPLRLLNLAILPALAELSRSGIPDTLDARRMVLAIALQETSLAHRRQVVSGGIENGPASSFWQFEQGGGCKGVLTHYLVATTMRNACVDFNVDPTPAGLWEAMRYNDIVAAIAARLMLYTLPSKLATAAPDGWAQYTSAWRPGKPHPESWAAAWDLATLTTGAK